MDGWMWLWGTLMMLAFVVAVAIVVWALVRSTQPRAQPGSERARDVLAERYARGEIDSDEYRERLETIGN